MAETDPFASLRAAEGSLAVETEPDPFASLRGGSMPDVEELTRGRVNAPHGILNAIVSAVQSSGTGLLLRGELPTQELPEDATTGEKFAAGVAGIAADIPTIAFGAAAGAAAGTAIAGPAGTVGGAAAGGFGAPAAVREYLMQVYRQGGIKSFGELWEATKAFASGGAEGAALGLGTAGPGAIATKLTTGAIRAAAVPLAEITGLTATAAALQQRMPTFSEFQDNALLIGGFRLVPPVARKLQDIYEKAGVEPGQVLADALSDTTLMLQLRDRKRIDIPSRYESEAAAETGRAAIPERKAMLPEERARAERAVKDPFPEQPLDLEPVMNSKYYNGPKDEAAIVAGIAKEYQAEIISSKRGTVSWAQENREVAARLVDDVGVHPRSIYIDKGIPQEQLGVELKARHAYVRRVAADIKKLGTELAALGEQATDAQFAELHAMVNRGAMIAADFAGLRAEVGRAQNSHKDLTRPDLDPVQLRQILDARGGRAGAMHLAKAISESDNPASVLRVGRSFNRTKFQTAIEIWKAGILSGFSTFEVNVLGNLALSMNVVDKIVMVGVGRVRETAARAWYTRKGLPYEPPQRVEIQEAVATLHGMRAGGLEGLKLAGAVIRNATREREARLSGEANRLAAMQARAEGLEFRAPDFAARVKSILAEGGPELKAGLQKFAEALRLAEDKLEHAPPAKPGTAMHVVQFPFRALTATDAFFRTMAEQGEAHALATRSAFSEGMKPGTKEFSDYVKDLVLNPTPDMAAAMIKAGDRGVYTTKLGRQGRALQNLVRDTPLEFIVPFIRTPINLMKWSAGYVPGVNFLLKADQADIAAGGVKSDRVVARMLIGSAIGGAVVAGIAGNTITGGGFHLDDRARAARRNSGIPDYSIKLFGTWYEYRRLQPMGAILGAWSDYLEIAHHGNGGRNNVELLGAVVAATGSALISQQYLQGLSNAVNAISDPDRYGGRWLDQYAASLVPSLIGQTAATIDPHQREINSITDAVQARIPVWN